jgi:hypothetical protein
MILPMRHPLTAGHETEVPWQQREFPVSAAPLQSNWLEQQEDPPEYAYGLVLGQLETK